MPLFIRVEQVVGIEAETGVAETGVAKTGVAKTGAVEIGAAIGGIIDSLVTDSSFSTRLVFPSPTGIPITVTTLTVITVPIPTITTATAMTPTGTIIMAGPLTDTDIKDTATAIVTAKDLRW